MKKLAFAIGVLALALTASVPARADFAIVKFHSGYCRVWGPPAAPPQDFQYLAFRRGWPPHIWWQHMFAVRPAAEAALHEAIATNRCHHM